MISVVAGFQIFACCAGHAIVEQMVRCGATFYQVGTAGAYGAVASTGRGVGASRALLAIVLGIAFGTGQIRSCLAGDTILCIVVLCSVGAVICQKTTRWARDTVVWMHRHTVPHVYHPTRADHGGKAGGVDRAVPNATPRFDGHVGHDHMQVIARKILPHETIVI